MAKRVLCVGAFAMDTIFRLETLPAGPGKFLPLEAVEVAEGMAAAKAATIARLGGTVALWASCGDDFVGDRMIAQLTAEGVDCAMVRRVAGARSGFSSIFMDRTGERMIVPQYDAALRSAPEGPPDLADVALVSTDVRWPEAARMALSGAKERNIDAILDLDVGPRDVLEALLPLAPHVVASEPAAALVTGTTDPMAAATALAARFSARTVVVTAGERGSYWVDRDAGAVRSIPAFKVDAVDTLAAGDAFHAGVAMGLVEGWTLPRTLRFASAVAAIKCTRFGGRLGAPTRAEVEALLAS